MSNSTNTALTHADTIHDKLIALAGVQIANTWRPLVIAALLVWFEQGDMTANLTIDGKQIEIGGVTATAQGVLDAICDALGDDVITGNSTFDRMIFN